MPLKPSVDSELYKYLEYSIGPNPILCDKKFLKRIFKYTIKKNYRHKLKKKSYNDKLDFESFLDKYYLDYECAFLGRYIIMSYESNYKQFRIIVSPNEVHHVINNIWSLCKKIPTRDSRKNSYHILAIGETFTVYKNGSKCS